MEVINLLKTQKQNQKYLFILIAQYYLGALQQPAGTGTTSFSKSAVMNQQRSSWSDAKSFHFKPIRTIVLSSMIIFVTFWISLAAYIILTFQLYHNFKCAEYFVLLYAQMGLWFLTLIVDRAIKARHLKFHKKGYLTFYKETYIFFQCPIYIISLFNITSLLIEVTSQHYYPRFRSTSCLEGYSFPPIKYLTGLLTVEFFPVVGIEIPYIWKVYKFNKLKPLPDSYEVMMEAVGTQLNETEKVFNKQANVLRSLKLRNAKLSEKIRTLEEQMYSRSNSDDSN
ncbi:hypothetical protein ILUMI_22737 [Ignelater luminosus]|uniref:Transmembrane protein 192 n=1 Tax=Ignelater luminosus TaxID=2038154 RepID=A0A8K0CDS2_IGNLU|nr:hypothetical protein ILUMI_22737 [Ignelater luminosus]